MKSTKLILTLSVIIVLTSLVLLVITLDKYGITGRATDTATANITISSSASITFTDDACDFGSGAVDELPDYAIIYTANTSTVDGTWTACDGLTLANDGNVNVTLTLASSAAASTFIGGTNEEFKWKTVNTPACTGTDALNTSYVEITGGTDAACTNWPAASSTLIEFLLRIPEDAPVGAKGTVITATGTA